MYFDIEIVKQRLDAINKLRVDRALGAMPPDFKHIYSILPTLLHVHHPFLPGYIEGKVPHGICFYTLEPPQAVWLDEQGICSSALAQDQDNSDQPITGVYSMGSTSSLGQNANSDLDIWVCHQSWLNKEERGKLQRKCALIEQWATEHKVEVNLFLIDENRFRHHDRDGGSNTQQPPHILLLDEFYRTAVRMGGKRILWQIVPGEEELNYKEYVLSLYASGVLTPHEWLDLGRLDPISVNEYFGASRWQLSNSKYSPYKAVLKTLLLEAYSWEYPQTELLSRQIKQRVHNGEIGSYGLDPYYLMLERVTDYLIKINDITRLDMVRRCFYWKVCEKLSHYPNPTGTTWRRHIVNQLVHAWGWDHDRLQMLDNSAQIYESHHELLDAMRHSYHNLKSLFGTCTGWL